MVLWVQMIVGALSLAKEVIKLMQAKETDKKKCHSNIKGLKSAIKQARISGDTNELEKAFRDIGRSANR